MEVDWIFGFLLLSLVVGLIIRTATRPTDPNAGGQNNEALEIAKKRFAKGELSEREFDQIRSKILSPE